ncbi:MAG TPA: methyltransferase [Xanthobacteraceae bacterium]|jgi:tRNA1(Val) A37 N6-methylase TrmN6|nr:methyltransferase [Xanthobacteraceae bacterium]
MATLETTDDAVLGGRLKLLQPAKGHRAGHDAILLAAAAPASIHAVDLGAGVGTAGLALLARKAAARVTLVEIDPELAALARENAARNGFKEQTEIAATDALKLGRKGGAASPALAGADLVLMNPPFNDPARKNISPDPSRRRAHNTSDSDLGQWIGAAERLLAPNGRLVLIHRPEAIEAILATLKGRFGAAELIPIFPRADAPAIRLIVRAIKGRRTPPVLLPGLVLNDADNRPSVAAEAILRDAGPLAPA